MVSDSKQDASRELPNWVEPDRVQAIQLLRVITLTNLLYFIDFQSMKSFVIPSEDMTVL